MYPMKKMALRNIPRFFLQKYNATLYRQTLAPLSSLAASSKSLKPIDDLPGPPDLFGLGFAYRVAMGKFRTKKPFEKLALDGQFADVDKYGNIFRVKLFDLDLVTISDPADIAKVLRTEPKYPQRLNSPHLSYYRELRKTVPGVFFSDGEVWHRYRSTVSKRILKPREVAEYLPVFNEIVADFTSRLHSIRSPAGTENEFEVVDLDNELFKWSFESVAHVLFDRRFGCLAEEVNPEAQDFIKSVGGFLGSFLQVILLPVSFYKVYETKTFKEFINCFDNMYKYADMFITKKVQQLEREGRLDPKRLDQNPEPEKVGFVEFLLTKENLSTDDLMASIIDLLFAGVDTTSNTMQWFLYMMSKNPDKQEKLYQEITSVLENDELPSSKTLTKMPYLKACFKESLRLYPVLSTLTRVVQNDIDLQGYHIPKGSSIQMMLYYTSRTEKYFKNASEYIPERWLRNEQREGGEIDPFASIPFGFGTRMCAGRRIAEMELYLLATRLVQKYKLVYPENEYVEPYMRGVIIPDRPLRVKFLDRV